jgi:3-oxoacyl-[acyl-carrier-protein] synthase-3
MKKGGMETYRAMIAGSGLAVPEKTLTNDDLAAMVDTSDEWISTRTGIQTRCIAEAGDTTATLASAAARQALDTAALKPEQIDLILVSTITPEMIFPSTACFVQSAIGATNAWAFDLSAACSGFVYGLSVAQQFIETGRVRHALVVGAETMSRITDWEDRASCILFGDGAGAVLLSQGQDPERGLIYSTMGSDGNGWKYLNCKAYGSRNPVTAPLPDKKDMFISIRGREIYQQAVRQIVDCVRECLAQCQLTVDDVHMLIPHQMNARIIESAAKRLKLPDEKVFVNIDRYGNTSAASIPIALHECKQSGSLQPGDVVVFVAFGAGLTWGANVVRM